VQELLGHGPFDDHDLHPQLRPAATKHSQPVDQPEPPAKAVLGEKLFVFKDERSYTSR
jgi:hypothetical protein